jgi:tetrahydromethanopterin:alpha-L-glutamate ligase
MKIAVIGTRGAWSTEGLAAALRFAGCAVPVIDLSLCSLRLPDPRLHHRGLPVEGLEGVVVKKIGDTTGGWMVRERINLLRQLETAGVTVLSEPDRLEVAVDRYRMTLELTRAGLPVPDTVVTEDIDDAMATVERFGSAILKPLFTSKGRGMERLDPIRDVRTVLARHRAAGLGPFYLQRAIKHPGRDLGVAVLDGQCLGAYWRVAGPDQWMTTIRAGGRYERAVPPTPALEIALTAARHFGLVFTGVDLMETPDGGFVVLEVSAFGGFRGLSVACGIDAAPLLADVIMRRVKEAR